MIFSGIDHLIEWRFSFKDSEVLGDERMDSELV